MVPAWHPSIVAHLPQSTQQQAHTHHNQPWQNKASVGTAAQKGTAVVRAKKKQATKTAAPSSFLQATFASTHASRMPNLKESYHGLWQRCWDIRHWHPFYICLSSAHWSHPADLLTAMRASYRLQLDPSRAPAELYYGGRLKKSSDTRGFTWDW